MRSMGPTHRSEFAPYMYVYVYVCMYVCMYVCIYTHTHTHTLCIHIGMARTHGRGGVEAECNAKFYGARASKEPLVCHASVAATPGVCV